nr:hypothetical protein [uncultured Mediterranean phage uvMED]BAR28162.1 hypothetical protein [uncultured Mediterranean phage uvMED]
MDIKRSNFYPNGEIIDYSLPQSFRKSLSKEVCANCGLYSNKRSFCGRWGAKAVKDTYVCHEWRKRFFKR